MPLPLIDTRTNVELSAGAILAGGSSPIMETHDDESGYQRLDLAAAKAALIKIRNSPESKKMDAEAIKNLHPQLRQYTDWERRVIEHPLLRTDLYYPTTSAEIDRINSRFERTLGAWQEAMHKRQYATCLNLTEKPYRLDAFVDQIEPVVSDLQYWKLLGDIWIHTEFPYTAYTTWSRLFASKRPGRVNLMDKREQSALLKLPSKLTIYRGGPTAKGLSWTLSEDKARYFANRFDHDNENKIFTGTVLKNKVYAYFRGRKEEEIVVNPKFITLA